MRRLSYAGTVHAPDVAVNLRRWIAPWMSVDPLVGYDGDGGARLNTNGSATTIGTLAFARSVRRCLLTVRVGDERDPAAVGRPGWHVDRALTAEEGTRQVPH